VIRYINFLKEKIAKVALKVLKKYIAKIEKLIRQRVQVNRNCK